MKLKMVIVDFEISSAAKKRLIRYGVPLVIVLGGGALAWAGNPWALPQPSFPQNGPLTAADLNNNFNALADAGAALQAQVATLGIPSGTVIPYAGVVGGSVPPPQGWLLCDGTAVGRTQYADLFTAIGTGWGGGDGATTFNLPDLRGRFLRGVDATGVNDPDSMSRTSIQPGGNVGPTVGTLESYEIQSHAHGVTDPGHAHYMSQAFLCGGGNWTFGGNNYDCEIQNNQVNYALPNTTGISIQDYGGSETRPANVAVNYIIKL